MQSETLSNMLANKTNKQTNENGMMCGEGNSEKNSEFQMGFEPTTFRTLVGCSNH